MSLQSFGYFAFLPLVAAVYLLLPKKAQPALLAAASTVFYLLAARQTFATMLCLCLFTYGCGRGLAGAHKKFWFRLGLWGSLGMLAACKYGNFFARWLTPGFVEKGFRLAMPLGISFALFAALSYLIDAAQGDCPVETDFVSYFNFFFLFATITSGPICRAGQLLPQLKTEHRFDASRTRDALRLFALGLWKKVAIADVLGLVVDTVFAAGSAYNAPAHLVAAVLYTLQLYFDFCGYSEMARASGLFLGLALPENFKTPFFATNFSTFWARWHISLSSWLQDYLFTPLVWADASRIPLLHIERFPALFCVFTVFFVSGFWHGNTLPFVVWGLLQALYRVGEELLHQRFGRPKKKAPARVLWAKRAGVFVLWTISMVFFRIGSGSEGLSAADGFLYLTRCVVSPGTLGLRDAIAGGFYNNNLMIAAYVVFVAFCLGLACWLDGQRFFRCKDRPAETVLAGLRGRWVVYYLLIFCILAGLIIQNGGFGGGASFAYANF